jgi:amidase
LPGIVSCAGPITQSFDDLELFVSSVLSTKPWMEDSNTHAVTWRTESSIPKGKLLRIGVLPEDSEFPLHPPIRRTLEKAIACLAAAGHKIVRLDLDDASKTSLAYRIAIDMFGIDPAKTPFQNISASGEPIISSVQANLAAIPPLKPCGLLEFAAMNREKHAFSEAWRKIFKAEELDAVIGPAAQHTAVPHDKYGMPPYTVLWNLLDVCFFFSLCNIQADLVSPVPSMCHAVRPCLQRSRRRTLHHYASG